ncbi:MAG: hypothetical protein HY928_07415 [Elusimicrobia bacterium]|nr:hypothetical protein [Elusimicrobiota bacterium]
MRYWLFEDDRLEGPYTPEELGARPRFTGKTLVHPEERQLLVGERWVPAYDIPQLAPVLAAKERAAHGKTFMPPDPAVRDLPVLGALLEQTERLERVLVGLRREIEDHHAELAALREDGKAQDARAQGLEGALAALRSRMDAVEALKEDTARLAAAFAASEADRAALAGRLTKLVADLEAETSRTRALADEVPLRWKALSDESEALRRDLSGEKAARLDSEAELAERISLADAARAALAAESARLRESEAAAEAALWRLGPVPLSPRGLLAGAVLGVLLAAAALFLILRPRHQAPVPPPAAPAPAPVKAAAPAPLPEAPPTPRPKPRPRAETKAEKEKRIKATILLRATGGVPSSNKKAASEGIEKLSDSGKPPAAPSIFQSGNEPEER